MAGLAPSTDLHQGLLVAIARSILGLGFMGRIHLCTIIGPQGQLEHDGSVFFQPIWLVDTAQLGDVGGAHFHTIGAGAVPLRSIEKNS